MAASITWTRPMLLALAACCVAAADPPPAQTTPGATPDAPPGATPDAPRSLDDLLGVPDAESKPASAEDAARREQEKRLQRSLDEASMQGLVQQAVEGMKSAADRLTESKDAGLGTQRIQEDVVRALDRLLEEAKKQEKKKSSRSSQSKQSKSSKGQDPSEKNGQDAKQRPQRQSSASKPSDGDSSDAEKSATRGDEVAESQELEESRIEWGRLPERVRELVLQGRRDRVSTIYERLTREYYRRLAEEASR